MLNSNSMENYWKTLESKKPVPKFVKKINIIEFDKWTLLGTTILQKKEWLQLFKIINYKGDYYFTTAKSLNLY